MNDNNKHSMNIYVYTHYLGKHTSICLCDETIDWIRFPSSSELLKVIAKGV